MKKIFALADYFSKKMAIGTASITPEEIQILYYALKDYTSTLDRVTDPRRRKTLQIRYKSLSDKLLAMMTATEEPSEATEEELDDDSEPETYYDSAAGYKMDKSRALKELKTHNIDPNEDFEKFWAGRESVNAQELLDWLGY